MKTYESIVTGIDFSAASDQALREAERLAKWNGSDLTVLHVLDESLVERLNEQDTELRSKMTSLVESEAKARIRKVLGPKYLAKPGFVIGDPFKELQTAVAQHRAEVLVLGSGHEPGHIGAVASKCVRHSPCDVLLVRGSQRGPFRKVVACVDFSKGSLEAVEKALMIAQQEGATLELLHVYRPLEKFAAARLFFIPVSSEVLAANDATAFENVSKELETLSKRFAKASGGVEIANVMLRELNHKKAIIDYLNRGGADLIVLGKRGRTNLPPMLLGATAERVINHAQCSVLAVDIDD